MVAHEVSTYNVHNTPFAQLNSLEDAILKGFIVDDQRNKQEHISIASFPSLLFPALKSIRFDHPYLSVSHIECVSLNYAISCFQEHPIIQNILSVNLRLMSESNNAEILRTLDVISKLDYCTPSRCEATSITLLSWCREWINSNCWALGLSKSQLCIYALLYGLSRYTLTNTVISQDINSETAHFERYLSRKNEGLIGL